MAMHIFGESDRIRQALEALGRNPKVAVLGDLMLDRYLYGDADRISPEAPVPVLRVRRESRVAGGAANVALNLARLGADTMVIGYVGKDADAAALIELLASEGIKANTVAPETGFPTITKTRVVGGHQQMLRIDRESPEAVDESAEKGLMQEVLMAIASGLDAILLSDYAKGVLSRAVCEQTIAAAKAAGVPCFVDPKGIDYTPYAGATCISPNRKELAAAVHHVENDLDGLLIKGEKLQTHLGVDYVLATLGDQGMAVIQNGQVTRYPTQAQEVYDVSGAGDTVIATLAFASAAKMPTDQAVRLANSAAGFVVGKIGTYAISRAELLQVLEAKDAAHAEMPLGPEGLKRVISGWQELGKTVKVFSGSFDQLDLAAFAEYRSSNAEGKVVAIVTADPGGESVAHSRGATLMTVPQIDAVAILSSHDAQALLRNLNLTELVTL